MGNRQGGEKNLFEKKCSSPLPAPSPHLQKLSIEDKGLKPSFYIPHTLRKIFNYRIKIGRNVGVVKLNNVLKYAEK